MHMLAKLGARLPDFVLCRVAMDANWIKEALISYNFVSYVVTFLLPTITIIHSMVHMKNVCNSSFPFALTFP